jgi:hypothetical protein
MKLLVILWFSGRCNCRELWYLPRFVFHDSVFCISSMSGDKSFLAISLPFKWLNCWHVYAKGVELVEHLVPYNSILIYVRNPKAHDSNLLRKGNHSTMAMLRASPTFLRRDYMRSSPCIKWTHIFDDKTREAPTASPTTCHDQSLWRPAKSFLL